VKARRLEPEPVARQRAESPVLGDTGAGVRIAGWRIDGFGVLRDHAVDGLGDGLTVLHGCNEAGKTTQLAFLRYVLFGFPDRRTSWPQYEPQRGGAHGGTVLLRGAAGLFELTRHKADKVPRLVGPDGGEIGDGDLTRLLGHADANLFNSVFAFGLDELASFDTLNAEGIRQRIFGAGISGAGPSAREASRQLGKRAEALLKGRASSVVWSLLACLDDLQASLQTAAREAARYPALLADEERMAADVARLRRALAAERSSQARFEALLELGPRWREAREAEGRLAELPLLGAAAGGAGALAAELPLLRDRVRQAAAHRVAAGEDGDLADALCGELGAGWDEARVMAFDPSIPVRDEARAWALRLAALDDEAAAAQRDEALGRDRLDELRESHDELLAARPAQAPPELVELEERELAAGALREQLAAMRAMPSAGRRSPSATARLPSAMAAVLAMVGGALALIALVADAREAVQVALAALGAALIVAGVVAFVRLRPASFAGDAEPSLTALRQTVARRALELGLSGEPSADDVAALDAGLRRARTARAEYDLLASRIAESERRIRRELETQAGRERRGERARCETVEADEQWRLYKAERGFPEQLSPAGVAEFFEALDRCRGRLLERRQSLAQAQRVEADIAEWHERAVSALQTAGRHPAGLDRQALERAIEALRDDVDERERLEALVRDVERQIDERFGARGAEAARRDFAAGGGDEWRLAVDAAAVAISDLEHELEEAIGARRDACREREALERSADVPRLQAELEAAKAELADAVAEYRELALAKALIDHTLREFMRTRQPEVLAFAGQAFQSVTGGRYSAIVQPDDVDAELRVLGPDGPRTLDQISRGTKEQLYVCLRLGLAREFAGRSVALPFVMDDCLVNFDPGRAAAAAELLLDFAGGNQVLLFTCHPETIELLRAASGGDLRVIELPGPACE
jgi:hypothetical protein